MSPYFITGTGTGVGKTLVAAIIAEALNADYWKPVQAGNDNGTDSKWVKKMMTNKKTIVHPEAYKLKLGASPHIAAYEENIAISVDKIISQKPDTTNALIVEGTGGVMVPLSNNEFMIDLIKRLEARVIIVSKNYFGSINHSLLTAKVLQQYKIDVMGWIFNDNFLDYETEIVQWSGLPWIASVRSLPEINKSVIFAQSVKIKEHLKLFI